MKNTQIQAVIFDMDGVILDSETICWRTWDIAASEYGLNHILIAKEKCMGTNKNDTFAILRNIYGKEFPSEKFLARTSELFYEIEDKEGIPLMPYAKEALEYLNSKYQLALASSTRKEAVYRQLTNAGVMQLFKTITTGDMVTHSKPDPEIYLMAARSLNIKPENCAAVEDSPNGIRSAFSAEMKTIMVPDKIKPDEEITPKCWKIISSLKEIETVL